MPHRAFFQETSRPLSLRHLMPPFLFSSCTNHQRGHPESQAVRICFYRGLVSCLSCGNLLWYVYVAQFSEIVPHKTRHLRHLTIIASNKERYLAQSCVP